ncbi:MAG: sulfatase-like hydrolase/transferase [Terriglobales bacterium]
MRLFRWLQFLVLVAQCARAATVPPSGVPARPNIILITLDTTRADRMGFLGSTRGLTPNLDTLARQSVVFSRAYAQVPLTTPSHANIFTGTYTQYNHVSYMGQPLTADLPYLPDILHHRGYRTAAFVGSMIIDSKNPVAAGFGRGFDTYDAPFHNRAKGEDRYGSVERRAQDVVDHALAWLKMHPQGPFFIWVHCYDPHAPYDPPEPYKTRFASEPYDGEIAYTDSEMGKLFAGLRARGLYDKAIIAVMADHGEALGEHGEHHHGIFLYDETIHVPLLFKMPGQHFAGERVDGRVRLVDVAPTILEAVGSAVPTAMQGESLLGLMKRTASGNSTPGVDADRPAYAESDYAHRAFGWSTLRAWRTGKYLYVDAPERELYDQTADPGALHNLAPNGQAVADTMQSQSDEFRRKTARAEKASVRLSPEQSENLRALGYVGTDSSATAEGGDRGPDPKGKTEIADLLDQALVSIQEQEFEAAIPKLREVLKAEPNTALAYLELGRAYVHIKESEKALPYLRTAVEKLPDDDLARFNLGRALVETGHWAEAAPQFEAALAHNQTSSDLHFYLAVVYERSDRIPEAVKEFRATVQRKPDHFRANLLLGRLLGMQGDGAEALPYLRQAEKLDPKSVEVHMFLANVYGQLGQTRNAERERAEVEHLKSGRRE